MVRLIELLVHSPRWLLSVFAAVLFSSSTALSQLSDEVRRPWSLGPGISFYETATASDQGIGPTLLVSYRFHKHFGLELSPTILLKATGFRDFKGLGGELGAYASAQVSLVEFNVSAGISSLVGQDGSGGQLGRGGLYIAGQVNVWLHNQFGVYGRYTNRLWLIGHISEQEYGRGSESGSSGIIIRF